MAGSLRNRTRSERFSASRPAFPKLTLLDSHFMRYEMKVRFLAIGGILLAGLIFLLLLASPNSHSLTRRLPDGSWLKIVSISYGSTHSYLEPGPKPWQSFLL